MKLNSEPSNVLTRQHWWSDDAPRWMNRALRVLWLVGSALVVPLLMLLLRRTVEQVADWPVMGAVTGATVYGIGLSVYRVGR